MTEKEFKFYQERALRYTLFSVVHNTNMLPDLDEEQRETVLNNLFNIILNSLKPDAAVVWNDEILALSKQVKNQQSMDDVMSMLRNDFENGFEDSP